MGYWIVIPMTNHGDGVNGPEVPYNSVPVILSSFFKFFIISVFIFCILKFYYLCTPMQTTATIPGPV
jgi:hypothetical protein